jgi:signal transduction histidine kinase
VFRTRHEHLELPPGVPLVAYRTVQEALTNVSKHARAQRVTIDLSLVRGVLSIEVSDDGGGFDREALAKARSFGIRGLRERAETVGGWVDVSSGSKGTTVILSVPVAQAQRRAAATVHDTDENEQHDPSVWGTDL